MKYETPITDTDLHAYLDGQLSEARRLQVEAWLKLHPDKHRELQEYQLIDRELQNLFEPVLRGPVPDSLRIQPRKRFHARIAAAAAFLAAGIVIGWNSNALMLAENQSQQLQNHLIRPAAFAHVVFTAEKKHPVEVGAEQEQHLVNWLSNRLNTRIKTPDLSQHGYQLVGGRLLPSSNSMAAQFMYQDKGDKRVTLYVRHINDIKADVMFQFARGNRLTTFYWVEGSLGYALSGELDKVALLTMARTTYQQLSLDV